MASTPLFWPFKNRDLNRTGLAPHVAPFDLSKPAWLFQEPQDTGVFHSGPILDADFNVFFTSTNGMLYSLTKSGHMRWSVKLSGTNPGNPALMDGTLYTASDDGMAHAVDAATGALRWTVRIGASCPDDTFGAIAVNGTVILPASPAEWQVSAHHAEKRPTSGGDEIVALYAADGREKWRYKHAKLHGAASFNVIPAVVDGSVVFDDMSGGLYRLSFESGEEQWYEPGFSGTWSTGAMSLGPNDRVYVARNRRSGPNCDGRDGIVRAHDLHTGRVVWEHSFPVAMNVGLAVGPLRPGGPLTVIAAPGNNTMLFPHILMFWPLVQRLGLESLVAVSWPLLRPLHYLLYYLDVYVLAKDGDGFNQVVALDAETGQTVWSLDLSRKMYAMPNLNVRRPSYGCAPDIFGNPSIGADGTVYISWSGGKVLALRDSNGDGKIDPRDPQEYSSYDHGYGSNGNPAIGPGFMVAPSCNYMIGYIA